MPSRSGNDPARVLFRPSAIVIVVLMVGFLPSVGAITVSADGPISVNSGFEDRGSDGPLGLVSSEQTHEVENRQIGANESVNRLVINASGGAERSFYDFTVSGVINPEKINAHDTVTFSHAEGYVGAEGKDIYRFTGEITDFNFEGSARVYLNGIEINPNSLSQETVETSQSTSEGRMTAIVFNATGGQERSYYRFEVSGVINPKKVNAHDRTSYRYAEGYVGSEGKDIYRFSGTITEFEFNGPATVYLNGSEVDPNTLLQQSTSTATKNITDTTEPDPTNTPPSTDTSTATTTLTTTETKTTIKTRTTTETGTTTTTGIETATDTGTSTISSTETATNGSDDPSGTSGGSGPGFGALAAICGIVFGLLLFRD